MGETVIVVDTNQIRDSPMLRSRDWTELFAKADEWGLRFVVPEVCFLEAVSVVRRKLLEQRAALAKLQGDELDVAEMQRQLLEAIDGRITGYGDALWARLAEIGAEVAPVPESVSLLDVAKRAIDRRAPYPDGDGTKDGFRDTLIWYVTRNIAAADRECEVWLVSTNHMDFGVRPKVDVEACPYPLHEHLIDELVTDELAGHVQYVRTIGRLAQHFAGTYDALPATDREALFERMDRLDFARQIEDLLPETELNPRSAALPVRTFAAEIQSLTADPESLRFIDAAMRGAGAWTAQYSQTIEAVVDLTDHDGDTSTLEKTLSVSGRLLAAADGTVTELLVTSVEAPLDDPMRRAWTRRSAIQEEWMRQASPMTDYLKHLSLGTAGTDYLKHLNLGTAGTDYLKHLNLGTAGTDYLKHLNLGTAGTDYLKHLNLGTAGTDYLKHLSLGVQRDVNEPSDPAPQHREADGNPDDEGDGTSDSSNGDR
jgi:PIN domain